MTVATDTGDAEDFTRPEEEGSRAADRSGIAGDEIARFGTKMISPMTAGGVTQSLMIYVDDVDAHCEQAREHGAKIVDEPSLHDYGEDYWADRSYGALDPEGHMWWFTTRLRDPKPKSV